MKYRYKSYSDEVLVSLLRQHELAAFDEIYIRYWKKLYSMSYRRVQCREVSQELVQDIFTSLWVSRTSAGITNLSAYLFTAVKYRVINHLAKEMSRKTYVQEQIGIAQEDNSTEEAVLLDDLNMALERAIGKLPEKRQLIFKLHRQENLSVKQVASKLGVSEKTVENQFGKAIKTLKVSLRHFTFSTFIGIFIVV